MNWFWNIFKSKDDQDSLFSLLSHLSFPFFSEENFPLIKDTLIFINSFLEHSPYDISPEITEKYFQEIPKIIVKYKELIKEGLDILTKLIPTAPVTLSLNADIFSPPFQRNLIDLILDEWATFPRNETKWQITRAYLLQFITYTEVMDFTIPEEIVLSFYNKMQDVWSSTQRRATNLNPKNCVQYLRFDVEIFKRIPSENYDELSKVLVSALSTLGESTTSSDFSFLLTAIAKYAPNLISNSFWAKILSSFTINANKSILILNTERIQTPYIFLRECQKKIENTKVWDTIFTNSTALMKNTPNELSDILFSFICHLIKFQRLSTQAAHEYQSKLWTAEKTADFFCINRLKAILLMIYYYGFKSGDTREHCFQTMVTLLESAGKVPSKKFVKYVTMILCSTVQSHAISVKIDDEPCSEFEQQCDDLAAQMRFGRRVPRKEYDNEKQNKSLATQEPLKSQHMYTPSNENSQLMTGDTPPRSIFAGFSSDYDTAQTKPARKTVKQPDNISLCNFLNKEAQNSFISALRRVRMHDTLDTYLFRMYKCIYAPNHFSVGQFLNDLATEFNKTSDNEQKMAEIFPFYILLLNSVSKTIDEELFQPFFEKIERAFFSTLAKYLSSIEQELKAYKSKTSKLSWKNLDGISNSLFYVILPKLSKFCSRCVVLCPGAIDEFMSNFVSVYEITKHFPKLHLNFVKPLIPLSMSIEHFNQTLLSLNESLQQTLHHYCVPIREREKYVSDLLEALQQTLVNEDSMQQIFITLSRYELTENMKERILKLAKERFCESPSLFFTLWKYEPNPQEGDEDQNEDADPFFIMSNEQKTRITAIDAIVGVLESPQVEGNEHNKLETYEMLIAPSINGILDDPEKFREESYTSIATLTHICQKVPELSKKILTQIIILFSTKKLNFPNHSVDLLFGPFSERVHYSFILRSFLPLIIKNLLKDSEFKIENMPLNLFFDLSDSINDLTVDQKRKIVFRPIAPYIVCIAVKNNDPQLLEFLSRALGISIQQLMDNSDPYLVPFLYASSLLLDEPEEVQKQCREQYENRTKGGSTNIPSPTSILDLINLITVSADESPLKITYQVVMPVNKNRRFFDFHKTLLTLYDNVYSSNHLILQSYELSEFSLFCQILTEQHKDDLNTNWWLYVDMFVLTTNMLSFAPQSEIEKILNIIGGSYPPSLRMDSATQSKANVHGVRCIVTSFEDICTKVCEKMPVREFCERYNVLITSLIENIDGLLDVMMIVTPFAQQQTPNRTFASEFRRIAATKRVNRLSVDFMVTKLFEDASDGPKRSMLKGGLRSPLYPKMSSAIEEQREGLLALYKYITEEDHYAPAILVYTELYTMLYDIFPSPTIIKGVIKVQEFYLDLLNSLVRVENPRICIAALEAIRNTVKQLNSSQLTENLTQQISEYAKFPPEKEAVIIPDIEDVDIPWVSRSVISMIEKLGPNVVYYPVMELAALSPDFAEKIYPQVFLAATQNPSIRQLQLEEFDMFQRDPEKYPRENMIILRTFVELKNYIFITVEPTKNMKENWFINWMDLKINFSSFSKTALKLGDPYLAYFFAEFSRETSDDMLTDQYFKKVFTKLSVSDLMYDLNTDISDLSAIASIHEQENRLNRALLLYDHVDIKSEEMHRTLRNLHLDHLQLSQGPNTEVLWRLQKWDIPSAILRDMDLSEHNTQVFRLMQSFAGMNTSSVHNFIEYYFDTFRLDKKESTDEQLSVLLDSCSLQWFEALTSDNGDLSKLLQTNKNKSYQLFLKRLIEISQSHYHVAESSAMLNGIFLANKGFLSQENAAIRIPKVALRFFSDMIRTSADMNEVECAQYFVQLFRSSMQMSQPADFLQLYVLNADSPLRSVALLKKHIDNLHIDPNMRFTNRNSEMTPERAQAFNLHTKLTLGKWFSQTHFVQTKEIVRTLEEVIEEAETVNDNDILAEAYITLSRFEHNLYRESSHFFSSQDYESLKSLIQDLENQLTALLKGSVNRTRDIQQLQQDKQTQIDHLAREKEKFTRSLVGSIQFYLKVLQKTNKYDLEALYNVINLWFNFSFSDAHKFLDDMPEIIDTMENEFIGINAAKFLPLFYQLAARIMPFNIGETPNSSYASRFQEFLHRVVKSVCYADPCVCYPILFALTKNMDLQNRVQLSGTVFYDPVKIKAVNDLIQEICDSDKYLPPYQNGMLPGEYMMDMAERWTQMSQLLEQYVYLAHSPASDRIISLRKGAPELASFQNKKYMFIITNQYHPPIARFADELKHMGGLTKPIRLRVISTDGRRYHQILKGNKDDLRQDAVMQQLFLLSSQLLEMNNTNLKIRSYKVVPLTPTAGLIECVERANPIFNYLEKAHDAYRTESSITLKQAFEEFFNMSNAYHAPRSDVLAKRRQVSDMKAKLINTYKSITERFRPVFRFFFVENFGNTADWFKARLNYCRHTATNSMVGFVFGIGDRHLNNIMIDTMTGEVIHIDLGIAFEQGKMLPISEIVPFRLTPDVIDGFGHSGGMGVFRRSCEESLRLLRKNSEYLLTVLDVFMRDPLYNWSVVPKRGARNELSRKFAKDQAVIVQPEQNENITSRAAKSVILRCRRKLEGTESGEVQSIEGQVAQLISEASDPSKLAMMFTGWKPFL